IIMAQNYDFEQHLYQSYDRYKESSLTHKRFKHSDILPLINKLKSKDGFKVKVVGKSVEGRELNLITIGKGKIKVYMWSQMHGDEPTATAALFDIFNFINAPENKDFCDALFERVTLYFLPMVNPDGAERFKRRNFYDIDLNRDASRLQCPEAIILKSVFDSLKADFGFNLHDQSHRYSVGNSFRTASISFLAPAFNYAKDFNGVRNKAVQLIGNMYNSLSQFIPGHIAKYSDEYEPRAFGDNFQKWGTSTILIESGGWKDDPEKQFIRKLNFIALLSAFKSIAEESYLNTNAEIYESIPFNDKYIFDLILRNLTLKSGKQKIKIDVGINLDEFEVPNEKTIYYKSRVEDLGDLSTYYGYNDYDFSGCTIEQASVYDKKNFTLKNLQVYDFTDLYSKGFSTVLVKKLPEEKYSKYPINLALKSKIDTTINIGEPANFILKKDGKISYIIINGFLQKIEKNRKFEGNGMIFR
ncbi:MAG TPA: M14 family metallopeptidase, partial [Ignavibacteriaceae bacterium]|nr:M14 family metallopeptidase [Ignavibacteriaceae bacterium]HRQ55663.1 M14 family metallopeptidase [Ignavibacteriaceae bacterium]